MRSSDAVDEIAPAWVIALGAIGAVAKGHTANTGTYTYTYTTINDVLAAAKPVLLEQGLALSQACAVTEPGRTVVTTRVWHTSGQWIEDDGLSLPSPNDAQKVGGAITYARRYALTAFLGLETPDDDGQEATEGVQAEMDAAREAERTAREEAVAEEALAARRATVMEEVGKLDADGKAAIQEWKGDRKISVPELREVVWLEQVEAWLDERNQT